MGALHMDASTPKLSSYFVQGQCARGAIFLQYPNSVLSNAPNELLSPVLLSPCHVSQQITFFVQVPLTQLWPFFCFEFGMGVQSLPIDSGRRHGDPHRCYRCDLCHTGVVGNVL